MNRLGVFLSLAAVTLFPLQSSAQNALSEWGAISISLEGQVWSVQNAPSQQMAQDSALSSCWNHAKIPEKCIVRAATSSLAAGRCVHRTASGKLFTRIGVSGGPSEAAARQNVIAFLIHDGNVNQNDCAVMGAVDANGTSKPVRAVGNTL